MYLKYKEFLGTRIFFIFFVMYNIYINDTGNI